MEIQTAKIEVCRSHRGDRIVRNEELCVCDISEVLGMTKSAVSHQLKVLKDAQLVKFRRDGKNVFYTLKDHHVKTILEMGIAHIKEKD